MNIDEEEYRDMSAEDEEGYRKTYERWKKKQQMKNKKK